MNMTRGKTALLVLLMAGAGYYGYSKYQQLTPSAAVNNGVSGEFGGARRNRSVSGADGEARHKEFVKMAGLTPEQDAKIRELRKSGVEGRDRWTSMSAVLTPEQRDKMRVTMQARRDKGAKATLSAADFELYKQKRDAARAAHGPRPGNGGGQVK